MTTENTKKVITLNASGVKFSSAFKTVVTKILVRDGETHIVLDALPNVELSLGSETQESLHLQVNQQVTVIPIENVKNGSFNLEIGEVEKAKPAFSPNRGSGPLPGMTLSNNI